MRQKIAFFAMLMGLILFGPKVMAQLKTIQGTVYSDSTNLPLEGVSVKLLGKGNKGVVTDKVGHFEISVSKEVKEIEFSYVGYQKLVKLINEIDGTDIFLKTKNENLDDIVVIAYGRATKKSITGSVAQVNAKDIEKRALTSVTGVLEGAAPGIQVNNTYGQPGSTPTIRIRGFSSINGSNTPLVVLDGVVFSGSIADLNPNDIESVSVLKDAASSALYGNRASNGVIIVTTKKGKAGNVKLNFIANQGIYNRGLKEYERMGPNDFMETMWKGYRNNLLSTQPTVYTSTALANAKASNSLIADYLHYNIYDKGDSALFDDNGKLVSDAKIRSGYLNDLDWYSPIIQNGHRQDYSISGSSGTEKSSLYFSAGYLDEKGFMKRSDFKRFTGRLKGDITPRTWIKAGFAMSGSHQIKSNYSDGNSSYANPIYFARNIAPIFPVHLHDMSTGDYILDADGNEIYDDGNTYNRTQNLGRHSIWENELNQDKTFINNLQGQGYVDIKFLKDFTISTRGDLNVKNSERQTYDNAEIGDGTGNLGRASRSLYRYKTYTFQQQLSWNKDIAKNNFYAFAGHENYNYDYSYLYGYKTNQTFANKTDLQNFTKITYLYDYTYQDRTESYLSSFRYNYNQTYYFDASFRADGTSRLYKDSRWGQFWSVGGAWLLSNESFMSSLKPQINELKLRASYGQVGNNASLDYYAWMALYDNGQNANTTAFYKNQLENKDLQWETQSALGIAMEGRFFNKLNLSVEFFNKASHKQIFDVNLPLSAGATSTSDPQAIVTQNIGDNYNRGWEFNFDVDAIKTRSFTWNIGANATVMKNRVTKLPPQNTANGIISGNKKIMIGHSIYDYWLYQYAGVDQMTGNALYLADNDVYNGGDPSNTDKAAIPTQYVVEINGKYYTTNPSYAKRDWSGSAIPKVYGSFNTSLTWKNISLSGLFTYSFGSKIMDYNYQSLMTMNGSINALHKDLLNAWNGIPEGMTETSSNRIDPKGIPVVDFSKSSFANATSSRFLQDGKYFVIKNIALTYKLEKSIVDKLDISSCVFNFTIENLATFTKLRGMDPQQSFDGNNYNYFMTPRVFSLGVNVGL
ncbi:SusC/RagA family TonB-linked outer membrane protein [Rhizosphaericola mali]|uniref:SusC/RagA family TonB-linked outer membrane protein n=1 Tax=Rhizosphaericola mali TaxID=2545455 RepID=A0A5P2GGC0_9BACT|nr:SusC/RagA family TonB-linked outer membrane protein [Rhizosphaericola mali]QES90781.1 SusC/RagA family TonB-linked outer membrane protein [Rhizosphaericola mali]